MAVKKIWTRFSQTQVWRAWKRYGDRRGNRLAGATTFFGFLSMFPLIVLAAAVTAALLPADAIRELKDALKENLPGIADKIDIDGLVEHAGTIGWISAAVLLFTGLGWIDALRASIRSMHELDDQPGNLIQLKLADLLALLGLGVIGVVATGTTSLISGLSDWIVEQVGLEGTWVASWGLRALSLALGVLSGGLLFLYLQSGLPRIMVPRKVAMIAALAGGIVFVGAQELGKLYVDYVIGNNEAYGALAMPLALLVWIYLLNRITMLIAAWAKEATLDHERRTAWAGQPEPETRPAREPVTAATSGGTAYKVVPIPDRKADPVAVVAGAVLGAIATGMAVTVSRAFRTVLATFRR
jgi:membrane protein